MKTAVSIPDDLFAAADHLAQSEGMSLSELYTKAIRRYVEQRSGREITESFDRLAEEVDTSLPHDLRTAAIERLRKIEW